MPDSSDGGVLAYPMNVHDESRATLGSADAVNLAATTCQAWGGYSCWNLRGGSKKPCIRY